MKHIPFLLALACLVFFTGCSTARHGAVVDQPASTVVVRLTSLLGMDGSWRDARIYVDGRFVGNYEPDETALSLPAGRHVVIIEVPRVYSRRNLPNGNLEVNAYSLKGEERIEVLGCSSKQSLVFNGENLKARPIDDADGH